MRRSVFKQYLDNQNGQAFILAIGVLLIVVVTTIVMISGAFTYSASSRYSVDSLQANQLAEAGIDKAVAALNSSAGSYSGETEVELGNGSFQVTVTNIDASNKIVESTGFIPNKINPKAKRTIKIQISKGEGVSFNYGVQTGEGGLELSNNARVNGSVYANGSIEMNNGSRITGDAYVAGGVQPTADQQSACSTPNCLEYQYGKNISGENRLDVAQSFQLTETSNINKVELNIKKFGSPPNVTVRILADLNGSPNKNNVLTSGTLNSNLVTAQYSFVPVVFTTTPVLTANTPYWIVVDTSSNSSNYWGWYSDTLQSYTRGNAKWSPNWQASNPVWTGINADLDFRVYIGGGTPTSIIGTNNSTISGSAHANTLQNLTISGNAYYQIASNITAANSYPNSIDPPLQPMPISEANITEWKEQAESAGITTGNIAGCPTTLGPGKYIGNVSFTNGCTVTVQTPIWITGTLLLDNGAVARLNASYGASSGVIITDGTIKLSNNGQLRGSGTSGSYLMGLSTYDSRTTGVIAIESDNGSNSTVLYANTGIILLKNNASLSEITGWKIMLDNGASVTYSTGLANMFFSSGPSGTYSVVKGSYQVK